MYLYLLFQRLDGNPAATLNPRIYSKKETESRNLKKGNYQVRNWYAIDRDGFSGQESHCLTGLELQIRQQVYWSGITSGCQYNE